MNICFRATRSTPPMPEWGLSGTTGPKQLEATVAEVAIDASVSGVGDGQGPRHCRRLPSLPPQTEEQALETLALMPALDLDYIIPGQSRRISPGCTFAWQCLRQLPSPF